MTTTMSVYIIDVPQVFGLKFYQLKLAYLVD